MHEVSLACNTRARSALLKRGVGPPASKALLQVPLLCFWCNRYAVFIDNDVMVPEGWLEGLYDLMEATQSWAVLPTYLEGGWCGRVRCCVMCAADEVLPASMHHRDEALDVPDEGSTTIHMAGGHCYAEPSSTRLGEVSYRVVRRGACGHLGSPKPTNWLQRGGLGALDQTWTFAGAFGNRESRSARAGGAARVPHEQLAVRRGRDAAAPGRAGTHG